MLTNFQRFFVGARCALRLLGRDDELEDAQWFTRQDLESGRPIVPPNVSISFRLIEHWFNAGGDKKLSQVLKASSWPASPQAPQRQGS